LNAKHRHPRQNAQRKTAQSRFLGFTTLKTIAIDRGSDASGIGIAVQGARQRGRILLMHRLPDNPGASNAIHDGSGA